VVSGSSSETATSRGYSRYTHELDVRRGDPDELLMGLIDLHKVTVDPPPSTDSLISSFGFNAAVGSAARYGIHDDHHDIVFFDPTDPTRAYETNDGGFAALMVTESTPPERWMPRNDGLQITGFQSLTSGQGLALRLIGGSQDNGGLTWTGSDGRRWQHMNCCGDGGFSVIDAVDPDKYYVMSNRGAPKVSFDNGDDWCGSGILPLPGSEARAMYAPLVQSRISPYHLYLGYEGLYRGELNDDACDTDVQQPVSWIPLGPSPPPADGIDQICPPGGGPLGFDCDNVITAIGLAPNNPDRVYIGYFGGEVQVTDNATAMGSMVGWTEITGGIGTQPITRIAVHPDEPETIFVTREGFEPGFSNVLKGTPDGIGDYNWVDASNGLPLGVPANTIHFEPDFPDIMWLGLDGNTSGDSLFRSIDGGASWSPYNNGLPNVPVYDIAFNPVREEAYAGTHGRGAFILGSHFLVPGTSYDLGEPRDVLISGLLFEGEEEPCSMELRREDGTPCGSSDTDALGATIETNSDGEVVTNLQGLFGGQPLVRACLDGNCAGGIDVSQCHSAQNPLNEIVVTCGNSSASTKLADPLIVSSPPSAQLFLNLGGITDPGSFGLSSMLYSPDGSSRSLCAIDVEVAPGETSDVVLTRARDRINADAQCQTEGLSAALQVDDSGNDEEDEFPFEATLSLESLQLQGSELVTGLQLPPGRLDGACFVVGGLSLREHGQLLATRLKIVTDPNIRPARNPRTPILPGEPQPARRLGQRRRAAFQRGEPDRDLCRRPRHRISDRALHRCAAPGGLVRRSGRRV
jgi:hypothetical protein